MNIYMSNNLPLDMTIGWTPNGNGIRVGIPADSKEALERLIPWQCYHNMLFPDGISVEAARYLQLGSDDIVRVCRLPGGVHRKMLSLRAELRETWDETFQDDTVKWPVSSGIVGIEDIIFLPYKMFDGAKQPSHWVVSGNRKILAKQLAETSDQVVPALRVEDLGLITLAEFADLNAKENTGAKGGNLPLSSRQLALEYFRLGRKDAGKHWHLRSRKYAANELGSSEHNLIKVQIVVEAEKHGFIEDAETFIRATSCIRWSSLRRDILQKLSEDSKKAKDKRDGDPAPEEEWKEALIRPCTETKEDRKTRLETSREGRVTGKSAKKALKELGIEGLLSDDRDSFLAAEKVVVDAKTEAARLRLERDAQTRKVSTMTSDQSSMMSEIVLLRAENKALQIEVASLTALLKSKSKKSKNKKA